MAENKDRQLIVYEAGTKTIVNAIAPKIGCKNLIELTVALKNPEEIDANVIGIVVKQEGKGVSKNTVSFIKEIFGNMDLKGLDYLYVAVIGPEKPHHSLKIVEKLCSKAGCSPSFSIFIDESDRADSIRKIADGVKNSEIKLAEGSFGTLLYMKLNHIC